MQGFNEFMDIFGHFTIAEVTVVILALIFLWAIYKKIGDYLMKKHDATQAKDAQLAKALETVSHYPEYRKQSIEIQQHLENKITNLEDAWCQVCERLTKIEELNAKKERNKLRDILIERYKYYTNKDKNPAQKWTRMESEAFWELFRDYEDFGGNDYMHTVVQPEMRRLEVTEM